MSLHMTMWEEFPPSLKPVSQFLQAVARSTFHKAWGTAEGREERRGEVETAAALPGIKAQECPVNRCGGSATFTHTRKRSDSL